MGGINWWSYWNNKTWNKKNKKADFGALLAQLTASILQPVISSAVKGISGRRVRGAGNAGILRLAPSFKQYWDYQLFQLRT